MMSNFQRLLLSKRLLLNELPFPLSTDSLLDAPRRIVEI